MASTDSAARTVAFQPPRRGMGGLYPDRLLRYRRPRWWQEFGLIAIGYWLYGLGRNAVPEQASIAIRHGRTIQHIQDLLRLNFERSLNHFVAANEWLAQIMNYYYATLHFIVTAGTLIWLFFAHPSVYRGGRTVLAVTTVVALVGFYLYPLAPPRLMPEYGYIDTLIKFHTWGSLANPKIAEHSNQFAAMPSLHIGWAVWSATAIVICARRTWVRALGALYPVGTLLAIVGTANHFILDAVGGVIVVLIGLTGQWLMSGRGAFTPPPDAPPRAPVPRPRLLAHSAAP
ncbi:MAG: phosphatase PAP2 family protein [Actinomycetota bacterium]